MSQRKKDLLNGIIAVLLTGGIAWATNAIVDHNTRLAVEESSTQKIEKTLDTIQLDIKELLRRK